MVVCGWSSVELFQTVGVGGYAGDVYGSHPSFVSMSDFQETFDDLVVNLDFCIFLHFVGVSLWDSKVDSYSQFYFYFVFIEDPGDDDHDFYLLGYLFEVFPYMKKAVVVWLELAHTDS